MADYVIVGGGSAGAVLAHRLSADPAVTVTLIEAGGVPKRKEVNIPAAFSALFTTDLDWNLHTVPQERLGGRELYWPRGRALGGSSVINAQMWVRGHRADYDGWAASTDDSWAYDRVLPYFQRAECRSPDDGDGHHGLSGPLHIQDLRDPNPATSAYLAACAEVGLEPKPHHNTGDNDGFAQTIVNQRRGRRWSSYDAYLKPAMRRDNLTVVSGAVADRVVVDDGRAVAVAYRDADDTPRQVPADREVILAAGAVNSPALLLRSGIGDPGHLADHGIKVVAASPDVGANLQDHLMVALVMSCPQPVTLAAAETPGQLVRYLTRRKGLLTSNVGEAAAFIKTRPGLEAPDIELLFGPVAYIDHGQVEEPPGHGITAGSILLQPESRGTVRLASTDPAVPPVIDPAYLQAAGDLETMILGVRETRRLLGTDAMAPFVGEPIEVPASDDAAAIETFLAEQAETLYHPVGTCRMGADAESVVDPELVVRGVEGLRVADASVMPRINRGHTHAPTVMIGERAADLVQAAANS
jgi:choline dehydrogenase